MISTCVDRKVRKAIPHFEYIDPSDQFNRSVWVYGDSDDYLRYQSYEIERQKRSKVKCVRLLVVDISKGDDDE